MNRRVDNHKSSIHNYDANVLSFAIYFIIMIASFIPFLNYIIFALPLIIYVMEKKSDFVRSNSLQAFVVSLFSSIFSLMCLLVSYVAKPRCNESLSFCFGSSIIHKMFSMFGSVRWMFSGFIFVICLVLALRAYNYEEYKLNYVGGFIDKVGRFLNRLLGVVPISGKEEAIEEEKEEIYEEEVAVEDIVTSEPSEEVSIKDIVDYETPEEKDLKERAKINKFLSLFKKKEKTNKDTKKEKFNKKKKLRKRKKNKRKVKKFFILLTQKIKSIFKKKEKVVEEKPVKKETKKKKESKEKKKIKLPFKKKDKDTKKEKKKKEDKKVKTDSKKVKTLFKKTKDELKEEVKEQEVKEEKSITKVTPKKTTKKKTTKKATKKSTTTKSGSSRKQKIKNKIKKIQ